MVGCIMGQETLDLHRNTPIKMYKLEPSFKHEVNNGFPNDYAEKNKSEI